MDNVFFKEDGIEYNQGDFIVDKNCNISLKFGNNLIPLNSTFKFQGVANDLNSDLKAGIYNVLDTSLNRPIGFVSGFAVVFDRIAKEDDVGTTNISKSRYNQLQFLCSIDNKLFVKMIFNNEGVKTTNLFEITGTSALETLNTPTMQYAMELEGVKQDYLEYSLEKFKYDKQLETEQKAKYEAYELLLQENPNLTWEEFEKTYSTPRTMMRARSLSVTPKLKEPEIPESVKKFMEKYL